MTFFGRTAVSLQDDKVNAMKRQLQRLAADDDNSHVKEQP
jgi:hypothetical protein